MASTWCACRDCPEIVSPGSMEDKELCDECKAAGCEATSDWQGMVTHQGAFFECQREDAYTG